MPAVHELPERLSVHRLVGAQPSTYRLKEVFMYSAFKTARGLSEGVRGIIKSRLLVFMPPALAPWRVSVFCVLLRWALLIRGLDLLVPTPDFSGGAKR